MISNMVLNFINTIFWLYIYIYICQIGYTFVISWAKNQKYFVYFFPIMIMRMVT